LIWAEVLRVIGEGDIFNSAAPVPRDTARLAIDEIEVKLRSTIHATLLSYPLMFKKQLKIGFNKSTGPE
jgi:hypothetical protein